MSPRIAYVEKLRRIASREKGMRRAFLLARAREAEAESDVQFCKKMRVREMAERAEMAGRDDDGQVRVREMAERVHDGQMRGGEVAERADDGQFQGAGPVEMTSRRRLHHAIGSRSAGNRAKE